ncbi:MAG TPA: aminotransferase class V-fold PLP-dependent enzyme [Ktedonobacterales bacterium]|nr:aminotransferase class V-fold PLP-dependent enzyme [Ktedonobacterales bacterium]
MERLTPYKVRPASDAIPDRWETGTQAHELQAGTLAALEYLASLAPRSTKVAQARFPGMRGRRLALHAAMAAIQAYERELIERLLAGLKTLPGVTLYGLTDETDAEQMARRVPTVALTIAGHTPRALAEGLAARGIYAWDGNYYALTLMERLGLEENGGALRLGLAHYNTAEEVDRIVAALHEIVGG